MKGSMQEMSAKNAELQDALDDTRAEMEKLRGLQEAVHNNFFQKSFSI